MQKYSNITFWFKKNPRISGLVSHDPALSRTLDQMTSETPFNPNDPMSICVCVVSHPYIKISTGF